MYKLVGADVTEFNKNKSGALANSVPAWLHGNFVIIDSLRIFKLDQGVESLCFDTTHMRTQRNSLKKNNK